MIATAIHSLPLLRGLGSCSLLLAAAAVISVNGQYGHYPRPYPMAMENHHGFSPYYPARINHETLPISQAEFAQLVAESMATSNGPHHHHPPNTDRNYEGPEHAAMHNSESSQHYKTHRGASNHHGHGHGHGHHEHQSQYQPQSHQRQRPVYDQYDHTDDRGHGDDSHYQAEEPYKSRHNDIDEDEHEHGHATNEYQRAPVYEKAGPAVADDEEEEIEEGANYGGQPSRQDYSRYQNPRGHRTSSEAHMDDNRADYMRAAASQPIQYVIDSHQA